MTFEQKYLKYKSKYLALKNLEKTTFDQQGGNRNNILEVSNLTDTPYFISNEQSGGSSRSNNILDISNLTETPVNIRNQDGGKKAYSDESSSEDSNLSTVSSGGGKKSDIKKHLAKYDDSSDSDMISNKSSSSEFSLDSSSESLLSALEDSDSV